MRAVVVTHEPGPGLAARLDGLWAASDDRPSGSPAVERLLVVDNGSRSADARRELDATALRLGADRCELVRNDDNRGLAAALNQGLDWSAGAGAGWTLLLDQDSSPRPGLAASLERVVARHPAGERLAVVGTNYLQPDGTPVREMHGAEWVDVPSVITSGSIVASSAVARIGPMRESLFIDYVDHEFCLRARAAGLVVALAGFCGLRHGIGEVERHRLGPLAGGASHHSPTRRYYRTRNQLLIYRALGWREPGWLVRDAWQAAKSATQLCLFERERGSKLRAMLAGARDGLLGRDGRSPRW